MIYLISYDISENKLRTKISNKLLQFGLYRIQYSVFMGKVKSYHFTELSNILSSDIGTFGKPDDSIIILPLFLKNIDKMTILGNKDKDWSEIVGTRKVLII